MITHQPNFRNKEKADDKIEKMFRGERFNARRIIS